MPKDLRTFLRILEDNSEIISVSKEVDPLENLGGLAWEGGNLLGKATFFKNLTGFPNWRAASYVETSRKRMALALATTPREFIPKMGELLKKGPTPKERVEVGPVKDVISVGMNADVTKLPIHIMSELDAGPYTAGMAIIKDPETGIQNVSLHRIQVKGKRRLGISLHPGRHWDMIYQKYEARNEPMPIALAIGHFPVYYLCACWTFPFGVDEFEMAGTFMDETVRVVRGETVDLDIPGDTELVIEGLVPPHEREEEGPFAEHTGYARAASEMAPYIDVTAITHRKDAIYYALQGGKPISSSQILDGLPMEVMIYERIKDIGGFVDIHDVVAVPCAGGSHMIVVQLTPRNPGETKNVLMGVFSSPYIHPKIAIAVDDDVDPHDEKELMWSISTRVNPEEDIFVIPGTRGHQLDHSLPIISKPGAYPMHRRGSAVGIDATKPPISDSEARALFTRAFPKGATKYRIQDFA